MANNDSHRSDGFVSYQAPNTDEDVNDIENRARPPGQAFARLAAPLVFVLRMVIWAVVVRLSAIVVSVAICVLAVSNGMDASSP